MPNTNVEQHKSSEWWDIRKAAAHLGMSVAFLRKAVRLRKVPFARAGTKSLRFRRSDLDCWLEANGCSGEITAQSHKSR
jgi:excisionase family DNA binding protein